MHHESLEINFELIPQGKTRKTIQKLIEKENQPFEVEDFFKSYKSKNYKRTKWVGTLKRQFQFDADKDAKNLVKNLEWFADNQGIMEEAGTAGLEMRAESVLTPEGIKEYNQKIREMNQFAKGKLKELKMIPERRIRDDEELRKILRKMQQQFKAGEPLPLSGSIYANPDSTQKILDWLSVVKQKHQIEHIEKQIKKYLLQTPAKKAERETVHFFFSWWVGGDLRPGQSMLLQKEGIFYFACLVPWASPQRIIPKRKGKTFYILTQKGKIGTKNCHINYVPVKAAQIQEMVDEGELLLFKIHHRHLYKKKKNPDRSVDALKELFANGPIGLSSSPDVSWRKAVVPKIVSHPAGSMLVNRTDKEGNRIPEEVYRMICRYYNGEIKSLPKEVERYLPTVKVKSSKKDIIQNKRYTTEKFTLRCAVTKKASPKPELSSEISATKQK